MRWRWIVLGGCLVLAAIRFAVSGVYTPVSAPNLAHIEQAGGPLYEAIRTGAPVKFVTKGTYGPLFFMTLDPLVRRYASEPRKLGLSLYALQLLAVGVGLFFTWRSIREWFVAPAGRAGVAIGPREGLALLVFLWLTFSPMYYIMSTKNVETWELGLLAAGLFAYIRSWRSLAGLCVAAAALAKVLPLFFLLYFLIRDRRTLMYTLAWMAGILSISHVLYGPELGLRYLPALAMAGAGDAYALTWHENMSLKGQVVKAFGGWHLDPGYGTIVSPANLRIAIVVGWALQAAAVAWMCYLLVRGPGQISASKRIAWEWSLTSVVMLLVSPNTSYEYMTLALIAFSVAGAIVLTDDRLRGDWRVVALLVAAVVLVGTVLPRQLFNRLLPLDWLNRLAGNTHIGLSEAYQVYGFPLIGLLCLAGVLWLIRLHAAAARPSEVASVP